MSQPKDFSGLKTVSYALLFWLIVAVAWMRLPDLLQLYLNHQQKNYTGPELVLAGIPSYCQAAQAQMEKTSPDELTQKWFPVLTKSFSADPKEKETALRLHETPLLVFARPKLEMPWNPDPTYWSDFHYDYWQCLGRSMEFMGPALPEFFSALWKADWGSHIDDPIKVGLEGWVKRNGVKAAFLFDYAQAPSRSAKDVVLWSAINQAGEALLPAFLSWLVKQPEDPYFSSDESRKFPPWINLASRWDSEYLRSYFAEHTTIDGRILRLLSDPKAGKTQQLAILQAMSAANKFYPEFIPVFDAIVKRGDEPLTLFAMGALYPTALDHPSAAWRVLDFYNEQFIKAGFGLTWRHPLLSSLQQWKGSPAQKSVDGVVPENDPNLAHARASARKLFENYLKRAQDVGFAGGLIERLYLMPLGREIREAMFAQAEEKLDSRSLDFLSLQKPVDSDFVKMISRLLDSGNAERIRIALKSLDRAYAADFSTKTLPLLPEDLMDKLFSLSLTFNEAINSLNLRKDESLKAAEKRLSPNSPQNWGALNYLVLQEPSEEHTQKLYQSLKAQAGCTASWESVLLKMIDSGPRSSAIENQENFSGSLRFSFIQLAFERCPDTTWEKIARSTGLYPPAVRDLFINKVATLSDPHRKQELTKLTAEMNESEDGSDEDDAEDRRRE
jgi:hypothetical protein